DLADERLRREHLAHRDAVHPDARPLARAPRDAEPEPLPEPGADAPLRRHLPEDEGRGEQEEHQVEKVEQQAPSADVRVRDVAGKPEELRAHVHLAPRPAEGRDEERDRDARALSLRELLELEPEPEAPPRPRRLLV